MEPQSGFEHETNGSDIEITPENVKTTIFSKEYKEIIKLLYKLLAANSTVKLLYRCLELRILPKSFQISSNSIVLKDLTTEALVEFKTETHEISLKLLSHALERSQKRSEELCRNLDREKTIILAKLKAHEQLLFYLHIAKKESNQEQVKSKKRLEKIQHLSQNESVYILYFNLRH